jgi:hypothetical protein
MTVNPYATQQEVLAFLRELTTIPVFEGSVPDGDDIPMTPSGKIKPHIVINFAGLTEAPKQVNGITGARDDSYMQGFSTHAIAGDDDAARQVHNAGLMKLLGFVPYGCGEIRPAFFAGVGEISSLGQPTRYSAVQAYKFLMNSTTPTL